MTDAPARKPPQRSKHPWRRGSPEARTALWDVALTDDEIALIAARAAEAEMSLEDYMAMCLVGAEGSA